MSKVVADAIIQTPDSIKAVYFSFVSTIFPVMMPMFLFHWILIIYLTFKIKTNYQTSFIRSILLAIFATLVLTSLIYYLLFKLIFGTYRTLTE